MLSPLLRAQENNKAIFDAISLHSIDSNENFQFKQVHRGLLAVVFLSPECPLSQNYMLTLNRLQQRFVGKLSVIGVFPGEDYKNVAYQDFERKYRAGFRLVKDENNILVKNLQATITPEVFLLNEDRQVVFSGAIDDWVVSLGKKRKAATDHYLEKAINNALSGQPSQPSKITAIGCYINLQ